MKGSEAASSAAEDSALALENLELRLLLEAIHGATGIDFRGYAPASLKRRVLNRVKAESLPSISALQARALHDSECMERLVECVTVHHTSLFRDPTFWAAFRQKAVPLLERRRPLRLWVAGCSSGEEVYSLAIVLEEAGLAERTRIYATDLSESVIEQARSGVFPLRLMKEYTTNYLAAGGTRSLSDYYTADHEAAIMSGALRHRVVFARHCLASDGSFNEFHAILCRNVMIYFAAPLQARVHELLFSSLAPGGILALGRAETLRGLPHAGEFEPLDLRERIYQRKPQ
jgi:chemotaxis protein methyltransferase CheR